MVIGLAFADIFAIAVATALSGGVWLLSNRAPRQTARADEVSDDTAAFGKSVLMVDFDKYGNFAFANETGDAFMRALDMETANWLRFRAELLPRFPGLPALVTATDHTTLTRYDSASPADPAQISLETHPSGLSLHLYPTETGDLSLTVDAHNVFARLSNLDALRAAGDEAPYPIWLSHSCGRIGWANAAFRALDANVPRNPLDPAAPLFKLPTKRIHGQADRVSIRDTGNNRVFWYEVVGQPCGDGTLNFARDIQDVIKAEAAQRNFMQTLAKTFAHLSTGLAVFDRQRQLVMFNPALVDLTHLAPEFLTARPNLFSVFDQLRNNQIMPEPKNYANWRERITELINDASDGCFRETWAVSTGQTYRITGRPHPDGAIAFLFEDISAEISLTRHFRAEMEVTQSALNALSDSIAIFSSAGIMTQCNEAMMHDWDVPIASDDTGLNVAEMTRLWQKKCRPTPIWGDIRDCVSAGSERAMWSAEAVLKTGHKVDVQVAPIASGASLVTLRIKPEIVALTRKSKPRARTAA